MIKTEFVKIIQRLFFRYEKEKNTKRISLSIPFLFKLTLTKHWSLQGNFSIRFLIFSFYIGLYYGLGWSITPSLEKWMGCLRIHLKRVFISFTVGVPLISIRLWQISRLERKLKAEGKWD